VIAAAQTLGATLERAAPGLAPGARRAVRASAVAALHINACYRAEPTIRPTLGQGAGIWPPTIPRC
jgi:hypothetical protein